jgi:hypothetical protein
VLGQLRGALAANYHYRRGRLVLVDRPAYDAAPPGLEQPAGGVRPETVLASALAPEADVLLVLDAPGEVMFAGNGGHPPEVLERWRRTQLDTARRLPNTWVVDAALPPPVLRKVATGIVWGLLAGSSPAPAPAPAAAAPGQSGQPGQPAPQGPEAGGRP